MRGLTGPTQKAAPSKAKKKGKAAKVTKSAPSTPAPSDSEEEEEEDQQTHSAAVVKHKLFAISSNAAKVRPITNPTPRLTVQVTPRGKGTPFSFKALPDTGCTTNVISEDLRRANGIKKYPTNE